MPDHGVRRVVDAVESVFGSREVVALNERRLREVLLALTAGPGEAIGQVDDLAELVLAALDLDAVHEMRIGEWRADVTRASLQSMISAALLAVGAHAVGVDSLPVVVLALVLPYVVDIDRVEISASDRQLLAHLRTRTPGRATTEEWYAALPAEIRAQVTQLEFADVIDRLVAAGHVTRDVLDVHEFPADPYGLRLPLP